MPSDPKHGLGFFAYARAFAILSAWGIVSLSLAILLKATFMPIVMAGGSDMLVVLYRVPTLPASIALFLFSGCTLAYAVTFFEPFIRVSKKARVRVLMGLIPSAFFLFLSFHAITISSKSDKPELNEFLGPFLIRSFQAPAEEAPIPAFCRNEYLMAAKVGTIEKNIFLGFGYWSISPDVCADGRLSPAAR